MLDGFKKFILRGNVIDLAIGVVIGSAFGAVVASMVKDVIIPLIGLIAGTPNFSNIAIGGHTMLKNGQPVLDATGRPMIEGGIMIGNFMNATVSFLILAAVVYFLIVLPMNRLLAMVAKKEEVPAATPEPTKEEVLLTEIRDLLKAR